MSLALLEGTCDAYHHRVVVVQLDANANQAIEVVRSVIEAAGAKPLQGRNGEWAFDSEYEHFDLEIEIVGSELHVGMSQITRGRPGQVFELVAKQLAQSLRQRFGNDAVWETAEMKKIERRLDAMKTLRCIRPALSRALPPGHVA